MSWLRALWRFWFGGFERGYLLALDHAEQEMRRQEKRGPFTTPKTTKEVFDSLRREVRDG